MKNRVIIVSLATVGCFAACTSTDKEFVFQQPVIKAEPAQPEPQPPITTDFAYSYTENTEVPKAIVDYADAPFVLPDDTISEVKAEDNIIKLVEFGEPSIPITSENSSSDAKYIYALVSEQNTTTQSVDALYGGTVIGKQGTVVYIPEDAFEMMDSSDVEGPVTITIQEFFSKSDFILAGLSSVSGDKMIESSGMFNIKATTADGKQVRLKKGKKIRLTLPGNRKALKGTQIFYGNNQHADDMAPSNWVVANYKIQGTNNTRQDLGKLKSKVAFYVSPKLTLAKAYKFGNSSSTYLAVMQPNLKKRKEKEKNLLRYVEDEDKFYKYLQSYFHKKKLYDAVTSIKDLDTLKFTALIDERGKLKTLKVESKTIGVDEQKQIQAAFNGRKIFHMKKSHNREQEYVLYMVKNTPPTNDGMRSSFPVDNLGWINCDRFLDGKQPLIAMNVNEPEAPQTLFYCVFNKINSVMPGYVKEGHYVFPNVPKGADVIVVGIKNSESNQPELSISPVKTMENFIPAAFDKTTPGELKQKLRVAFGETPAPTTAMAKP